MADLIIAVVLVLGGTSAAEGLRRSFRRRLAAPVPARPRAQVVDATLRLPQ